MTVPVIESSSVWGTSSGTTTTVSKPTGTVEGDLLFGWRAARGPTPYTPSGFTLLSYYDFADHSGSSVYKIAGPSEPSSYDFVISDSSRQHVQLLRISGVNTSAPIDSYAVIAYNSSAITINFSAITTTVDDTLVLRLGAVCSYANNTNPADSPLTTLYKGYVGSSTASTGTGVAYISQASAGTTGTATWTSFSTAAYFLFYQTVAIAPAGGTSVSGAPGVGAVTVAGLAPTVTLVSNPTANPTVGAVTVAGLAPTAVGGADIAASSAVGAVTYDGLAPTASIYIPVTAFPTAGVVTVSGLAPSISTSVSVTLDPGAILVDGYAPFASTATNVLGETLTGAVALLGLAPSASNSITVIPTYGTVTYSGVAPTSSADVKAIADLGTVVVSGLAPTSIGSVKGSPSVGGISVGGLASTVSCGVTGAAATGAVTIVTYAPTASAAIGVSASTDLGQVIVQGSAATVSVGVAAIPAVAQWLCQGLVPTVIITIDETNVSAAPACGELLLTGLLASSYIGRSAVDITRRHRSETATVWKVTAITANGDPVFAAPREILVRWEHRETAFLGNGGEEQTAAGFVVVGEDLRPGDFLYYGSSEEVDPTVVADAHKIMAFQRTFSPSTRFVSRVAFLSFRRSL